MENNIHNRMAYLQCQIRPIGSLLKYSRTITLRAWLTQSVKSSLPIVNKKLMLKKFIRYLSVVLSKIGYIG